MAIYKALGRPADGDHVAVKLSMGEPGGHHFLQPALIQKLVEEVDGTIVDSNTAYGGRRASTALHYQTAEDHGFAAIAPVQILDEDGDMRIPVEGGERLTENIVGGHFADYGYLTATENMTWPTLPIQPGQKADTCVSIAAELITTLPSICAVPTVQRQIPYPPTRTWASVSPETLHRDKELCKPHTT